jgi:hypothetical protein
MRKAGGFLLAIVSAALTIRLDCALGQVFALTDLGKLLHTQRLLQAGDQGQGVRIGVISGGASNYAALARRGVLPPDIELYGGDPSQDDEGDWMMQVVHQLAPRAHLAFCPGGPPVRTVACARELVKRFGADLIVDDTNPQPIFDFPTTKALGLTELAREYPEVLFFTGAGNNGGGYYEGPWTPKRLSLNGTTYLAQDFGRSLGDPTDPYDSLVLPGGHGAHVMLGTSADPNGDSRCEGNDVNVMLALVDGQGNVVDSTNGNCPVLQLTYPRATTPRQVPSSPPGHLPFVGSSPQTLRIALLLPEGSHPQRLRIKLIAMLADEGVSPLTLKYRTDGSAGNSATTRDLVAVAAIDPNSRWHDRYLYETFANSGPQCQDYAPNASGGWTRLPGQQCIQQPPFVVPDRAQVLMFRPDGERYGPFIGDSAAGPAAAAVTALLLSAKVPAHRVLDLLEHTAIPQTDSHGWDPHYGYGLIDADAAAVAAGVLKATASNTENFEETRQPAFFHPTQGFLEDGQLLRTALQGSGQALRQLEAKAQSGDIDAQANLAEFEHGVGDNAAAARWAISAATSGEPKAQAFLGSMYNRGWGVPMDPRAAQAWWLRAAHAGIATAFFNIGSTIAGGRGAPADPLLGYALMRAAALRHMQFAPMTLEIARARSQLSPQQIRVAEGLAVRFAADPAAIPTP